MPDTLIDIYNQNQAAYYYATGGGMAANSRNFEQVLKYGMIGSAVVIGSTVGALLCVEVAIVGLPLIGLVAGGYLVYDNLSH